MTQPASASAPPPASAVLGLRLPRIGIVRGSILAAMGLVAASWVWVLAHDGDQGANFFSVETFKRGWDFLVHGLLGIDAAGRPAFARASEWRHAASLASDTLAMSILAIAIAGAIAFLTFMFGAHNVMLGELAPYRTRAWGVVYVIVRGLFIFTRSVPELVWAMIVIFIFAPGILPGAIALGIHNTGVLGKLASEVVEGLDPRPLRALRSAGAGRLTVLVYGVLPQALPRFLTFTFYRWEIVIRTTIVVGFVAAGGLGQDFGLAMAHFKYTTVTLLLFWYIGLVVAVDLAAALFRRLAD